MLKCTVIGNLGNDPELQYTASGTAVLRFSVASNYRARTSEGEWQDRTEWVRVSVFGARAESLSQILTRGTKVYADGRLEARPWTDREGQVRAGLEIVANEVELTSARQPDAEGTANQRGSERRDLVGASAQRDAGQDVLRMQGSTARTSDTGSRDSRRTHQDLVGLEDLPF